MILLASLTTRSLEGAISSRFIKFDSSITLLVKIEVRGTAETTPEGHEVGNTVAGPKAIDSRGVVGTFAVKLVAGNE